MQIIQNLTIAQCQALEDAAGKLLVVLRFGLSGLAAELADGLGHAFGIGESGIVGVDERAEGRSRHGIAVDLVHVGRGVGPFLSATFQQPHSADVLEETGCTLYAAFVGEVVFETLLVDDGILCLNAQKTPGSATQISEILVLGGHGSHGGTGIMACHSHYGHGANACHLLYLWSQHTHLVTGIHITAKLLFAQADGTDKLGVNALGSGVEHLACGEDGVFAYRFAGEHIHQGVGDEKNLVRRFQRRVVVTAHCGQLEERVEVHELDTGLVIDLLFGDELEVFVHRPFGVRVAVAVGIAQDAAVLANADKVHTPGVNADAGQLDAFFGHSLQAADNLIVQGINVPKEVSALLDDGVGKACHLALGELPVLNGT